MNENETVSEALSDLLLLVKYETGLPESAANGVISSDGGLDEGVVRAAAIIEEAEIVLNRLKQNHFRVESGYRRRKEM